MYFTVGIVPESGISLALESVERVEFVAEGSFQGGHIFVEDVRQAGR
jgi:hypothetical protein